MDKHIKVHWEICCSIFAVSGHECTKKLDLGFLVVTIKWAMLLLHNHCVYSANTNHYKKVKLPWLLGPGSHFSQGSLHRVDCGEQKSLISTAPFQETLV